MPDGTDLTITPPAPANYGGNLQDPYGSAGDLSQLVTQGGENGRYYSGADNPGAHLPSWLSSQFSQRSYNTGGDSGQDYTAWGFGQNNGTFVDANGNPVVQIGDPNKLLNEPTRTGEWLRDPTGALSGQALADQVVKYDPTIGYYVDPKYLGSKTTSDRGMEAFGATIGALGLGDLFLGADALGGAIDTTALPAVSAPTLPDLAALPDIAAPAASGATTLDGIDTALLPGVTAPTLPELSATPDITAPLDIGTAPLPDVTAPTLPDLSALPDIGAGPAAGDMTLGESLANTSLDGTQPFNVPMQAPPDIAPPDFTVNDPSFFDSALNAIKKQPFAAAGLGLSGISQILANRRAKDAASQLRQAAQPLSDEAKGLLDQYGKGQLNQSDEFRINQWEQTQLAKAQSLYGTNSTAAANAMSQITAQAEAMRSTALQGLLQAGIEASGMALGPLVAAIKQQAAQDQQFGAASANALRALMLLQTGGNPPPNQPGGGQ